MILRQNDGVAPGLGCRRIAHTHTFSASICLTLLFINMIMFICITVMWVLGGIKWQQLLTPDRNKFATRGGYTIDLVPAVQCQQQRRYIKLELFLRLWAVFAAPSLLFRVPHGVKRATPINRNKCFVCCWFFVNFGSGTFNITTTRRIELRPGSLKREEYNN